jgi:hypothetical protein
MPPQKKVWHIPVERLVSFNFGTKRNSRRPTVKYSKKKEAM